MLKFLKEFREFAVRGNVVDMGVGIIIGAAFSQIVRSFVDDLVMPPISLLTGKINFVDLYINLSGSQYESLAQAKAAGAVTLNYGRFLNHSLSFLIVAGCVFVFVRQINALKRKEDVSSITPTQKSCPFCYSSISIKAIRCPQCTSDLAEQK